MSYRQLSLDERYQIQTLKRQGNSRAEIARFVDRAPSTISRELARNRNPSNLQFPYGARIAHGFMQQRRVVKGKRSRKIVGDLQKLVEQKLQLSWSPEQISGRLRMERGIELSHETIYQHVLRDCFEQRGVLRYCLRFAGYKHHRFKRSKMAERTRLRKNWIDQRPKEANDRSELGHWERDLLLGRSRGGAYLTLVDRRSRYTILRYVAKAETAAVAKATRDGLRMHRSALKTITNDNGCEFQRDESLQRELSTPIFFCDPSSPWQRGTVENMNGLIRQYVAKGEDIDALDPRWPVAVEETLNFRPRKTLGYLTPHEVHFNERVRLTSKSLMRFGLEFSPAI